MASALTFRLANHSDITSIITYIALHWNQDHVYVRVPSLFYYDFLNGNSANFGLAEVNNRIEGIFGYFFYNSENPPDLGGMLWHVSALAQSLSPLAGMSLRSYVLENIPHRFFGAPGAGINTKPIYKAIGSQGLCLEHFVGRFKGEENPVGVTASIGLLSSPEKAIKVRLLQTPDAIYRLNTLIFDHQTPRKDPSYLIWRYLTHRFRNYEVWHCCAGAEQGVLVTRVQEFGDKKILRVIDYIGPIFFAAASMLRVFSVRSAKDCFSYIDFVCAGFGEDQFIQCGFSKIDFNNESLSLPNHFEPLVLRSSRVYANCNAGFSNVTMVKGNGDQDRPNVL